MTAIAETDVEIFEQLPADHGVSALSDLELASIRRAVKIAGGNRAHAARMLGISERTLYRKLPERVRRPASEQ